MKTITKLYLCHLYHANSWTLVDGGEGFSDQLALRFDISETGTSNLEVSPLMSPVSYLCCLLGERFTQLHDHVFVRLLVRNHVDAGNPLLISYRQTWRDR